MLSNTPSNFVSSLRKMNVGEADIEGNGKVTAIPGSPDIARGRVLAKIAALENSTQSKPQPLPSSSYAPLTEANLLLNCQQQSGKDTGRQEHRSSDSHFNFGPESTGDQSDEADESSASDEHKTNDSDPVYSPESADDRFEEGGETTTSDEQKTDDFDPVYGSESTDGQFGEADKGTGGRGHEAGDTDSVRIPEIPGNQSEDAGSTSSFCDELKKKILGYLKASMIEAVYGDSLSSSRRRRYEPKWPMQFEEHEPPLHYPASNAEAHVIFNKLYQPLRGWHKLSGNKNAVEDASHQQDIFGILNAYEQEKTTRPPPQKFSGNFLLYHNLPDAAGEVTVWSWINNVHVALRQKQWDSAEKGVDRAIILAGELGYKPLISKCWYWRGMVMAGRGDHKSAAECFLDAMHCVGVYQEGELLSKAVAEYKLELLELLDEQKARNEEDEWSRQVRRAITGIDGWFRPLKDLPRRPSYMSTASNPQGFWPQDNTWGDAESDEASPESQRSSEEQFEDYLSQWNRYAELQWFSDRSLRRRKVDWDLVGEIEEAAQKPGYVEKEKLYRICKGFSPAFEEMIRGEKFTDGFDNYPDIEESTAWKVLNYTRVKAKLKRPRVPPEEEQLSPQGVSVSMSTADDVIEASPQPLANDLTGSHGAAVEKTLDERLGAMSRCPPLTINPVNSDNRGRPCQTPTGVRRQMVRVHITAEEKIAAFEHNILHEEDDGKGKSKARLKLEKDPEWLLDINRQESKFDQHVQEEMAALKIDLIHAEDLVRRKNEEHLRDIWGPEGVRPPTPVSTPTAREEEHTIMIGNSLNPFKLEFVHMTYRRKYGVYRRLPTERQDQIAEPARPSTIIAYLEGMDKMKIETDHYSSSESHAIASESDPHDVGLGADGNDYISPVSPLRPHQRSLQTYRTKPEDDRSDKHGDPISSTGSISSTVNLQAYADINRLLDEPISRQLKAKLGIDAMNKAMRQARLNDEQISIEKLVQIGEIAIGGTLKLSSSKSSSSLCSPVSEIYRPWNQDTGEIGPDGTDLIAKHSFEADNRELVKAPDGKTAMSTPPLTDDEKRKNYNSVPASITNGHLVEILGRKATWKKIDC